jgi:hypothetical protein
MLAGKVEAELERWLDDLETHVFEAQQMQAGELPGDGTE